MESNSIPSRLPEPWVRAARESAKRQGRDDGKSQQDLREEFRNARAKAQLEEAEAPAWSPTPQRPERNPEKEADAKVGSMDARGRRLDIRV